MSSLSAKTVTVAELSETLAASAANHRSDKAIAARIAGLELSERITEDRLAALQSRAPGPRTAAVLEELAEQSAFLQPPEAERSTAAPPSAAEQKTIFQQMSNYVVEYLRRLPNFICTESIARFDDNPLRETTGARSLGKLHSWDTITAQVTYAPGHESVVVQAVNGKPYTAYQLLGTRTGGEFGNTIASLIQPAAHTAFDWSHWEVLHGKRLAVFQYAVSAAGSQYTLSFGCTNEPTRNVISAYEGFIFLDADSGVIVRLTRRAVGMPAGFPTQRADTAIEYGSINIGGRSYMLPVRSVTESDNPLGCDESARRYRLHSLNATRFSNYRVFQADSNIVAANQAAENQAKVPVLSNQTPKQNLLPEPAAPRPPSLPSLPESWPTVSQSLFSLPQPPPFTESDAFTTHVTFRERVNTVTVPVVVRDREGQAVSGLTKDDFKLFDNGKPQVITNFLEQRSPEPDMVPASKAVLPAAKDQTFPHRYVAYVFDDVHLNSADLIRTRSAAERVMNELLTPGTRIAILTVSGKVTLWFTDDRGNIVAALHRLQPNPIVVPDCPNVSYYPADRIVNHDDKTALAEVTEEVISKCGVDPRYLQVARAMALGAAKRSLSSHEYASRVTLDAIGSIAQNMSVLPGQRSLLLISPGFYVTPSLPGMQQVIDRASRSGLLIQALDAHGLYVSAGFDAQESTPPSSVKLSYETTEQQLDADPLTQLADSTGGIIVRNSNDFDAAFRRLAKQPSVVYVLGFSPDSGKADGAFHKLRVTVNGRNGLQIQARRGYIIDKPLRDAEKEAKVEVRNALFSRDDLREIPMNLKSAVMETANGESKLNVLLRVDTRPVQFQRVSGRNQSKLSVTFGFFDADGNLLNVLGEELPLDFSDTDLQARFDDGVSIRSDLDLKPGSRFMRVVLRDAVGQMSTMNTVIGQ